MPGLTPSIHVPHRSASSALCPCGHRHAASFRRRASSFVRGVWCLEFGGAVSGGGALRARAVRAACRAACLRVLLPCGCGCCYGGVCVATLTALGARVVGGAGVAAAWCARWVLGRGEAGFLSWLRAGRRVTAPAACMRPPCPCARDVVDVAAGRRRRGRGRVPLCAWCAFTALLAARVAWRHAARRRCWRGAGGRCRSWPWRGWRRPCRVRRLSGRG